MRLRMLVIGVGVGLVCGFASGEVRYRFTWIDPTLQNIDGSGPLVKDDTGIVATNRALGLNDFNGLGQVVGETQTDETIANDPLDERRAFIWLPEPAFAGLGNPPDPPLFPQGLHELDPGQDASAVARAINDSGHVVGRFNPPFMGSNPDRAFLWVAEPFAGFAERVLHNLGPIGTAGDSDARSVTNTTDPLRIVGTGDDGQGGFCADAFIWRSSTQTMSQLLVPGNPSSWDTVHAYAIRPTVAGQETELIVGQGAPCVAGQGCPQTDQNGGVRWTHGGAVPNELDQQPFGDSSGQARDINDANEIVGWALDASFIPCRSRAVFWKAATSEPIKLETVPPAFEAEANAINDATLRQVVGRNATQSRAALWECEGEGCDQESEWTYYDLNGLIADPAVDAGEPKGVMRAAHDVNESGWIVGEATFDAGSNPIRAFVLVPLGDCPADIDRNGDVGNADLTLLLLNWGACRVKSPNAICWADVNANRDVGFADLTAPLIAWGACPGAEAGPSGPSGPSTPSTGLQPALIAAWLEAGGDEALFAGALDVESVAAAILGGDLAWLFELIAGAEEVSPD